MRVLGIDPGSETLGWGVVEGSGNKYSLVEFGVVKSNPRMAFSKRLAKIFSEVDEIVGRLTPDAMSIEEAFYSINVNVAMKLGQVRGVMLLLAEQRGLSIAEYAPRLIKKTVVGYGNAEKQQVGEMVRILLGMKAVPTPHDAADALAIAICHFHHHGLNEKLGRATRGGAGPPGGHPRHARPPERQRPRGLPDPRRRRDRSPRQPGTSTPRAG